MAKTITELQTFQENKVFRHKQELSSERKPQIFKNLN